MGTTLGMMVANVPAVLLGRQRSSAACRSAPLHITAAAAVSSGSACGSSAQTAGWV
jgi:putative Ca2+/H+ antiporter (TMEM165/GDT1 family)